MPDTGIQLPLIASRSIKQLLMSAACLLFGLTMSYLIMEHVIPEAFGYGLSQGHRISQFLAAFYAVVTLPLCPLILLGSLKLLAEFMAPGPLVSIDREGLRDPRISKEKILWTDVTDYRIDRSYRGMKPLRVGLKLKRPPEPNSALLFKFGRGVWPPSRTSPWVGVGTTLLDISPYRLTDAIVALIEQQKANGSIKR
jgi:hypothetical protein